MTASSVAPDNVAVKVKADPFSATLDAEEVKVTVGALSFSVIVKLIAADSFIYPSSPVIVDDVKVIVSFPS